MKIWKSIVILSIALMYFTGCNVEKIIIVPKSDPDKLFAMSQVILKKEMPAAKLELNANERIIKATETNNIDYPSYIEMKFAKHKGSTQITLIIPEEEPQRVENLAFLLRRALDMKKMKSIQIKNVKQNQEPPKRIKKGRPVRNNRDRKLDRNQDGWVSPMEAQIKLPYRDMH